MTWREKLAERAMPFLEPGEAPRHVFFGDSGVHPGLSLLLLFLALVAAPRGSWYGVIVPGLLFPVLVYLSKPRVVAVTDRAIVLLQSSRLNVRRPKAVLARLPRDTALGALSGFWAKVQLGPERMWVHRAFHKDLRAAAADIAGGNPPAPPN